MPFIISLPDAGRSSVSFYGFSGKDYRFRWNETHRVTCLEGRELTDEEFDRFAPDIFRATFEQNYESRPVPKRIADSGKGIPERGEFFPRFDAHAELLKVCAYNGELEQRLAQLQQGIASGAVPPLAAGPEEKTEDRGQKSEMKALREDPAYQAVAAVAEVEPKPVGHFTDYDPDELPAEVVV